MYSLSVENDFLKLNVAAQGAAVLALESLRHRRPVLRPWLASARWHPGESALFPMLPLANRVAGNRFFWRGKEVALPESPLDTQFFLHGDGWLRRWDIADQGADFVTLETLSQQACGFHYRASLTYRLAGNLFQAELKLMHIGEAPMIYGAGFHPFFHLEADSRVQFLASGFWPEGEQHLPLEWRDSLPPEVDFSLPVRPANNWLNVGYSGWNGAAVMESGAMRVSMFADTPYLMVFRMADQPFICLEPQTHPVNAHKMPGRPGLVVLGQGDGLSFSMQIRVE